MSAIFQLCERNGLAPGSETAGITQINWKSVDDSTTPYPNAGIVAGSNSYTNWVYGKFTGTFSLVRNVTLTHQSGVLPAGVSLMCQPSMTQDSDRLTYSTPNQFVDPSITPTDLSAIGTSVALFVGKQLDNTDGPGSVGKQNASVNSPAGTLFTNYIVTQLQTSSIVPAGELNPVTLKIQWEEI